MKVISEPNRRIKCHNCGREIEYEDSDVRHKEVPPTGPYDMDYIDRYYVTCPCGTEHIVNATPLQKRRAESRRDDDFY